MNFLCGKSEKNAAAAILLCYGMYIFIPAVLVRFFPAAADFLRQGIWVIILPGILVSAFLFIYAKDFFIRKCDFIGIAWGKISICSLGMLIISAVSAWLWFAFLKFMKFEFSTDVPVEQFLRTCHGGELVIAGIFICIITPFIEEIIFRRVVYEGLRNRCPEFFSITVSSLLFAVFHGILFQLFPLFLLGLYFQLLYVGERKLGGAVFAHFFNNTFAFVMLMLLKYYQYD